MAISQRAVYIYDNNKKLIQQGGLTYDSETGLYTFVDEEVNINAGDIGSTELVVAVPLGKYGGGSAFVHYLRRDGYKSGLLLMNTQTRKIDGVDYQTFYLTLNQVGWTYTAGRHTFIVGYLTSDGTTTSFDKLDPAFYTVSDGVNTYEELNADEYEDIYLAIQGSFSNLENRLVNNEDFLEGAFGYTKVGNQTAVEYVQYDTVSPIAQDDLPIGARRWNDVSKTTEVRVSDSVVIQDGQEIVFPVRNTTGVTIDNGDVVYVVGALGGGSKVLVARANSTNNEQANSIIGVATENIENNSDGFVCVRGRVRGIDLSAFTVGNKLFLGTNGNLVLKSSLTKGLNTYVYIGTVENKEAGNNILLVDPRVYYKFEDLSDLELTNPTTDNIVIHDGTKWVNISKAAFLQAVTDRLTQNESDIIDLENEKANLAGGNTFTGEQVFVEQIKAQNGLDANNSKITNVLTGTAGSDAVNKAQLDDKVLNDIATHNTAEDAHTDIRALISALQGAYVFRGLINNTTDEITADTTLLTTYINTNFSRTPVTGDVLVDTDDNEWYYDGDSWENMGQAIISLASAVNDGLMSKEDYAKLAAFEVASSYYKKTDLDNGALDTRYFTETELLNGALDTRYYTETEIDALLDQLKAIYGWESSDLTPTALGNTDTLALSAVADYDQLLFVCRNTATGEIDTQKVPIVELTNGTDIEFFSNNAIVVNVDATNITFSDVGTAETLKIYGFKMEQQLAENIEYDNTDSDLDATDVKGALDELDGDITTEATTRASADNTLKEKIAEQDKELNDLKTQLAIANANNEPLVTQSVVSKVEHLPVNTAPLPLKVNGYGRTIPALENLVENGDFSDGTTGWSAPEATGFAVNNGIAEYTSIAVTGRIVRNPLNTTAGQVILRIAKIKATSNQVYLGDGGASLTAHSGSGNFEILKHARIETVANRYVNPLDMRYSGWDKVFIDYVMAFNLTASHGVTATSGEAYDNAVADIEAMLALNGGYIDTTDTTHVVNPTVESVGKNLFDKTKYTTVDYAYKIKVEPSQDYVWSESVAYKTYDKDLNEVASGTATTLTMGADTYYIAFANTIADTDAFQLEQGTVATTYEAYAKQSKTYVGTFRSVGDVQDEFRDDGVKIKKIAEYTLQASDIDAYSTALTNIDYIQIGLNAFSGFITQSSGTIGNQIILIGYGEEVLQSALDNLSNINNFSTNVNDLLLAVAKGTYANVTEAKTALAGTVVYYVLATPTEEPIQTLGDILQGSSKAQIINSNVIADLTLYDTNADILLTDSPIDTLTYLGVMDFETGVITDLDHTTAIVAGDGLSFTHASLSSGDIVVFRYTSTRLNGQLDVTYVNSNNVIEDTTDGKYYHVTFSTTNGTPSLVATEVG